MPRIKNSPNKKTSRNSWDALAKPIIAEAKSKRGFIAEVTRQLSKLLGREVHRQEVDCWLAPNKNKRVEPSGGTAFNLLKAVELARKELNGK